MSHFRWARNPARMQPQKVSVHFSEMLLSYRFIIHRIFAPHEARFKKVLWKLIPFDKMNCIYRYRFHEFN